LSEQRPDALTRVQIAPAAFLGLTLIRERATVKSAEVNAW